MNEIIKAIEAKDWRSVQSAIDRLVELSSISTTEMIEILNTIPAIVSAFPDQFMMDDKGDQIIWHRYEMMIWKMGETFRQILKKHTELRKDPTLFRNLERVALDTQCGTGRESFVLLLGEYGDQKVIVTLQKLLKDQEVQGHAVYSLRLLGAPEVQDSIRPFLQSPKPWIRKEAKMYFQKLEKHHS